MSHQVNKLADKAKDSFIGGEEERQPLDGSGSARPHYKGDKKNSKISHKRVSARDFQKAWGRFQEEVSVFYAKNDPTKTHRLVKKASSQRMYMDEQEMDLKEILAYGNEEEPNTPETPGEAGTGGNLHN